MLCDADSIMEPSTTGKCFSVLKIYFFLYDPTMLMRDREAEMSLGFEHTTDHCQIALRWKEKDDIGDQSKAIIAYVHLHS